MVRTFFLKPEAGLPRGRPSRNAANTFPDFSAGLSQNSVIVKKIKQLVEKHEKLTICEGNLAPFRPFFVENSAKIYLQISPLTNHFLLAPLELSG